MTSTGPFFFGVDLVVGWLFKEKTRVIPKNSKVFCSVCFFCGVTSNWRDQVGSCIEVYILGMFFFWSFGDGLIWFLVVCFWMSRDVVHGSKITWRKQRCGEFTVAAVSNLWLYMIAPFIPHTLINQFTVIVVHKCERQCHFLKDIYSGTNECDRWKPGLTNPAVALGAKCSPCSQFSMICIC